MKWLRLYSEARNDAKLRMLTDSQHRVWFNLLCFAGEQDDGRGVIHGYEESLLAVEVASGDCELLVATLERLRQLRIVVVEGETITFINFSKRQYDKPSDQPEATAQRKRVSRARAKGEPWAESAAIAEEAMLSHDVTPSHALDTDTETDTEVGDASASPTVGGTRSPGQVYALVDAFAVGKGLAKGEIVGRSRKDAYNALADAPSWVGPSDVLGCTRYLMSDPFWDQPGKLKAHTVTGVLPEWKKKGCPESVSARASPRPMTRQEQSLDKLNRYARGDFSP